VKRIQTAITSENKPDIARVKNLLQTATTPPITLEKKETKK
jgi:hypothetical protein